MCSVLKTSAVLAGMFLLAASGSARASVVEVKVPFPFVVSGHTLPAGTYRIESDDMDSSVVLLRGEGKTHATMFVLAVPAAGHDPAGQAPALTFMKGETQYQLEDVWESGGEGHQVGPTPRHHVS